jgi:hypothetical protein
MLQIKTKFFDRDAVIEQARSFLAPSSINQEISRSMNEAVAKIKTASTRDVMSQYRLLKKGMFTGSVENAFVKVGGKKAGKDSLSASFSIKGRRVTLGRYGSSSVTNYGRQKNPPRFAVKSARGGAKSLPYSFAVANQSLPNKPNVFNQGKGYQIFSRVGGNMGAKFKRNTSKNPVQQLGVSGAKGAVQKVVPTKGRYAGKVYVKGPRKGQPYRRQKVEIFRNIAISEMFNTKRLGKNTYPDIFAEFDKVFKRRLESSFRSFSRRNAPKDFF